MSRKARSLAIRRSQESAIEKPAPAAAPGSALWGGGILPDVERPAENLDLPIHLFQGEHDDYRQAVDGAWASVQAEAQKLGFTDLHREIIPEGEHDGFEPQAVEFFRGLHEEQAR